MVARCAVYRASRASLRSQRKQIMSTCGERGIGPSAAYRQSDMDDAAAPFGRAIAWSPSHAVACASFCNSSIEDPCAKACETIGTFELASHMRTPGGRKDARRITSLVHPLHNDVDEEHHHAKRLSMSVGADATVLIDPCRCARAACRVHRLCGRRATVDHRLG